MQRFTLSTGLEIVAKIDDGKASVSLVGDPLSARIARGTAVNMVRWGHFEGLIDRNEAEEITSIVNSLFTNV